MKTFKFRSRSCNLVNELFFINIYGSFLFVLDIKQYFANQLDFYASSKVVFNALLIKKTDVMTTTSGGSRSKTGSSMIFWANELAVAAYTRGKASSSNTLLATTV